MGILVILLIYLREKVPLKQNENVRRVFTPVLQEKRNISLKKDKVFTWVLFYAKSQSGFL